MNNECNKKPKTGVELINSFFEQLNENKTKYSCPEVIDSILKLHNAGKLTQTNITNILDEVREEKSDRK